MPSNFYPPNPSSDDKKYVPTRAHLDYSPSARLDSGQRFNPNFPTQRHLAKQKALADADIHRYTRQEYPILCKLLITRKHIKRQEQIPFQPHTLNHSQRQFDLTPSVESLLRIASLLPPEIAVADADCDVSDSSIAIVCTVGIGTICQSLSTCIC